MYENILLLMSWRTAADPLQVDDDEQHRVCEKEFELDDAYTVAMDVMPEHWKEEADAQLTYLRNMHACYPISIWKRIPGVRFLFYRYSQDQKYVLSVFSSPVQTFEYILEAQIPIHKYLETYFGSTFPFYRYFQDRTYVLSVF